jgi:hypothetical protein
MSEPESVEIRTLMSEDEIHDFGIGIVFEYMQKDGFEILAVRTNRNINPQILGRKGDQLVHVVVRTACYPEKGSIESEELALQLIAYAEEKSAVCYFASVGIANAEATNEVEMARPLKGVGYFVAYEGLQTLTSSDRVGQFGDSSEATT